MIEYLAIASDIIIIGTFLTVFIGKYREILAAQKESQDKPKH